jgi:putative FmdB family regulatory protein
MPNYTYECSKCKKKFEIFSTIQDYNPSHECSFCGSKSTQRSYIDDMCVGFVKKSDNELKTIGDLANRNRDRMSNNQKTDLYSKHNSYKETGYSELPTGMSRMKKPKQKKGWT